MFTLFLKTRIFTIWILEKEIFDVDEAVSLFTLLSINNQSIINQIIEINQSKPMFELLGAEGLNSQLFSQPP